MKTLKLAFLPSLALLFLLVGVGCGDGEDVVVENGRSTDTSLNEIKENGTLVVGVDIPYGIMEFYDNSGNPIGIDMEIAQEIASQLGTSLEIKTMPFADLFDALKGEEVDVVISAVTITPERQETMLFSAPYIDAGMSIAVKNDNEDIQSLEDLDGNRVGVLKGTIGEELAIESEHIDASLLFGYENNDDRIEALLNGELDAIIVHFLVQENPEIKIVGEPLSISYYGIVARLDDQTLMDKIDAILRDMKRSGRLVEIRQKYVNSDEQ